MRRMTISAIHLVKPMGSATGLKRDFEFPVVDRATEENGTASAQCGLAVIEAARPAVYDQFGSVGAEINQHKTVVLVSNLGMVA